MNVERIPSASIPLNGADKNAHRDGTALASPTLARTVHARIPTAEGEFQLYHFTNDYDGKEHLALVMGDLGGDGPMSPPVLTRVHSECFTGDVLGSRRCDCGEQLHRAMALIAAEGRGVIIYLRQEGRGIGLADKLRAYNLQDMGYDTVEANLLLGHQADERDYWAAGAILENLGVASIRLMTNNPTKIEHLRALGVVVDGRVAIETEVHEENRAYLETKAQRMRHMLALPGHAHAPFPDDIEAQLAHLHHAIESHQTESHDGQGRSNGEPSGARPYVTVTWAQCIDGSIAGSNREPLRISGDDSMRLTHTLRASHDAILVGIGTLLADNPQLTARSLSGGDTAALLAHQPRPVLLDGGLRTPPDARIFSHPHAPIIFTRTDANPERADALIARGAEIVPLPVDANGRLSLPALLDELAARGIRSLMVEGGAAVIDAFLAAHIADAVIVTIAPRIAGGLRVGQTAAQQLEEAAFTPLGKDVVVWNVR